MITLTTPDLLAKWRRDTPGCSGVVHLNNAGAALAPQVVQDAIVDHLHRESRLGGYEAAEAVRSEAAQAYQDVAALLGAQPRNIAIVENATVAITQALSSFLWKPGDRLLTTRADYASHQIMFLRLRDHCGVTVDHAPDGASGGVDTEALDRMLGQHAYTLVVATWIPTNSGLMQDVASIGASCERHGVPYLVDACQAVGQLPIDVAGLKCDFLAASARKFLRGPRGIGFLYISDRALERGAAPLFTDMRGATWVAPDRITLADDARRFENWEFSYALVLGLGAAARYALDAGVPRTRDRALDLAQRLRETLASDRGVTLLDQGTRRCAIVSLGLAGHDPFAVVADLRRQGINVGATPREHAILDMDAKGVTALLRVSPHYYNTEDELATFVEALRKRMAGPY